MGKVTSKGIPVGILAIEYYLPEKVLTSDDIASVGILVDNAGNYTVLASSTTAAFAVGDTIRRTVQGSLISLINVTTGQLLLTTFNTDITSGYPGISLQAITGTPSDHIAANWSGGTFH